MDTPSPPRARRSARRSAPPSTRFRCRRARPARPTAGRGRRRRSRCRRRSPRKPGHRRRVPAVVVGDLPTLRCGFPEDVERRHRAVATSAPLEQLDQVLRHRKATLAHALPGHRCEFVLLVTYSDSEAPPARRRTPPRRARFGRGRDLEADHRERGILERPGRARSDPGRRAARRVVDPQRAEHRRSQAHRDRRERDGRRDEPDRHRLGRDRKSRDRLHGDRDQRLLRRPSDDRPGRDARRDEHRGLREQRRLLGAPGDQRRPRRRTGVRQPGLRGDAERRDVLPGLGRHARHLGPQRPQRGEPEPRLPGSVRQLRLRHRPRDERDADDARVVLERDRPSGRSRAGGRRRRCAGRLCGD